MESLPEDYFVTSQQFTKHTYRDQYPSINPTSSALSQAGKVVIITGTSQGLGALAFLPSFAKTGPRALVLVARSADKLKEVEAIVKEINPSVQTLAVPTNVADPASVAALFSKIKSTFGHADVLVNNAGVLKALGALRGMESDKWWSDFELNARGTFHVTQSPLQSLPSPDIRVHIVSLTTGAAFGIFPGMSSYSLSKLVVLQLAAYVAAENPNVTAIALHPGVVDPDMTTGAFKRFAKDTPALVGSAAAWLASGLADWLRGRYVSANWSVDDLVEREDILEKGLLKINLQGTFGAEQFKYA